MGGGVPGGDPGAEEWRVLDGGVEDLPSSPAGCRVGAGRLEYPRVLANLIGSRV